MSEPSPEQLAAAARAGQDALLAALALRCDAIVEALGAAHGMVAWDCRRVIGRAQREVAALRDERLRSPLGGPPARVVERVGQPLECVALTWRLLRQGRRVRVEAEGGACRAGLEVLAALAPRLEGGLEIEGSEPGEGTSWAEVGVARAAARVAVVAEDGDRELAAYVLARTALRRSGADPRGVQRALVCGPQARLERHLQRLWVGARLGPPSDPEVFAGPASAALAAAHREALRRWVARPGVEVLCPGGEVEVAGEGGLYLAPALLRAPLTALGDEPALAGPMMVIHPCPSDHVSRALEILGAAPAEQLWIGAPPLGAREAEGRRYLGGALLVERVPPGLPDPRPV